MNLIETKNPVSMDKKYKTRDGRDVRVLCVDASDDNYPVVALIGNEVYRFTSKGSFDIGYTRGYDLIEQPEEKTVWLEIYRFTNWREEAPNSVVVHVSEVHLLQSVKYGQGAAKYKLIAIKKITYTGGS